MDYKTISVTKEQINKIPKSNFKFGHWQANYFIPVFEGVYHENENLHTIGVMGKCDAETIAKYLKINACIILDNDITEISYSDFMNLENF